jgi:hypothetical protein
LTNGVAAVKFQGVFTSFLTCSQTTILEIIQMQEYENLKVLVAEIESDIGKAEGGNKAAGTRVRKQMQKIKQAAQIVRNQVLEIRSTD